MISKLLGWASKFSVESLTKQGFSASTAEKFSWMSKVFGPIEIALYVIMGLVGAAGAIYAIYLGIQLARAEDQSKRDEAKKHLITVIIAVAVTIVLILFFNLLLPEIVGSFIKPDKVTP